MNDVTYQNELRQNIDSLGEIEIIADKIDAVFLDIYEFIDESDEMYFKYAQHRYRMLANVVFDYIKDIQHEIAELTETLNNKWQDMKKPCVSSDQTTNTQD